MTKTDSSEFVTLPDREKNETCSDKLNNTPSYMPHINLPIVVEGRYDKSAVMSMFSATVITTDGFSVFNSKEKQALIKKMAKDGIIILTDSDAGGKQIRSFISSIVPKEKIFQLYIPRIEGKERRKTHRGKEGMLGVEGVGGDVLRKLLMPFALEPCEEKLGDITSLDMFNLGLSGSENSASLRDFVSEKLELPCGMSAKSMLAALNVIIGKEELYKLFEV